MWRGRVGMQGGSLLALVSLALISCGPSSEASGRWLGANILLISIDTLRADRLGAYGYERETSPALDTLAARGVRFERDRRDIAYVDDVVEIIPIHFQVGEAAESGLYQALASWGKLDDGIGTVRESNKYAQAYNRAGRLQIRYGQV